MTATRVLLYARRSTDLQNPRSTADQFAALRIVAAARGWRIVAELADEGLSGANLHRPAVQKVLTMAERQEMDLVFAEGLDRLSRDQEGTAHLYNRLTFHGVELETLSEGKVGALHVGLASTINQVFLAQLSDKTRRGLVGRVSRGFSGGGLCYGYELVPEDEAGGQKGVFRILEREAEIVRRIFKAYVSGASPRAIAHRLNAERVPGPRGGEWSPSTIHGDRRTGDGLLHQELYIGIRVFNRRKFRKHPDTGKRSSVLNPPEAWVRHAVPELRIISAELWAAAQARKSALAELPAVYGTKPKRLLSRIMQCGLCGSGMTLEGGRYVCSRHRNKGTCTNNKIIAAVTIEGRVLEGVRQHLLSPQAIQEAMRAICEEVTASHRAALGERTLIERELAEVERRLARAQDMYVAGVADLAELQRVSEPLKAMRVDLQHRLAQGSGPPPKITPIASVARAYAAMAERLHMALDAEGAEELRTELRKLIKGVTFIPLEGLGRFDLKVHGQLAGLLAIGDQARSRCEVELGAGTGFEPVTFRL